MLCLECGADFDWMNESQLVCPGCGTAPGTGRDDSEMGALFDEAAAIAAAPAELEIDDCGPDLDQPLDPVGMPVDLREALDDAEALLLATGYATFDLPEGFRMFPLPTKRVM